MDLEALIKLEIRRKISRTEALSFAELTESQVDRLVDFELKEMVAKMVAQYSRIY